MEKKIVNLNEFFANAGTEVTWGSGAPRAVIVAQLDGISRVRMLAELKSPCGRVWPVGHEVDIPTEELREVQ